LSRLNQSIKRLNIHQLILASLLLALLAVNTMPGLRASALDVLADGTVENAAPIAAERILVVGGEVSQELEDGRKVTLRRDGEELFATSRKGETIVALLSRMGVTLKPLELVKVDLLGEGIGIEVARDFVLYETVTEAVAHTSIYTESYDLLKGEYEVVQAGQDGERTVVYELVYADGQFVSRQAVEEISNTSVPEIAYKGVRVLRAQEGDTIESVVENADGSGYLKMKSGDVLRFTGSKQVKCTAYTTGYDGVGTVTASGTTVGRGCVAVDKKVIPLGTEMFITTLSGSYTYGMARAEDTGVRGSTIDLYMDSYAECMSFGARKSVAYILDME